MTWLIIKYCFLDWRGSLVVQSLFPAPAGGGLQQPVTPAPGYLMPLQVSTLPHTYIHIIKNKINLNKSDVLYKDLKIVSALIVGPPIALVLIFKKDSFYFIYMNICLHVYICIMCMSGASGSQRRLFNSLELEFTGFSTLWVQETEVVFLADALNSSATSPALSLSFK